MIIVVKYFASISDAVGKTSEKIVLEHEMTVGEVWTDVSKNIKYAGKVMTAVNHEYVSEDHLLKNEDEVAFFPPVTGG
ncbi:MAG: molybdopterin converting factor subunit 1 [Pseudomonadota bacterium]|mgnify:FL=1|jgi:molybdopterin synthase sulfur carrier subunit|nr:molybdopterin converting factor subunit 1 [Pseudomonadota bacterium]